MTSPRKDDYNTPDSQASQEIVIVSKVNMPIEWIETTEASELIGVELSSVSRLCRQNKINCLRIGQGRRSVWLVDKASAIAYANSDKDVGGRPRKPKTDNL